jgi:hypothetical protein
MGRLECLISLISLIMLIESNDQPHDQALAVPNALS